MTTLLVVIIVLVVTSLALDVLILATLGNVVVLLFSPQKRESERIAQAVKVAVEDSLESSRQATARVPYYDA